MKREELEKYVGELSPEMQEKARQCKTMEELNALLTENDVELSEDALQAVSGGCTVSSSEYNTGDPIKWPTPNKCPECKGQLYYWDMCSQYDKNTEYCIMRMYCNNPNCSSFNNGLWYIESTTDGAACGDWTIKKY